EELGPPSSFTCPECSGTLYELTNGGRLRFRCRVGHAFSEDAMVEAQGDSAERALWTALRALEERAALMVRLATMARGRGHLAVASMFEDKSKQLNLDVKSVHDLITSSRALDAVGENAI